MPVQAELSLPDAAMEDGDMAFSGRYERSRDGLDCVAIFDGATWRLELLDGLVKGLRTTTRYGSTCTKCNSINVDI